MLSFFPRGVLDEILNLIESVSEDFPSYSLTVNISSLERKLVYTLLETQVRGICGEYGTIWEYDPPGGK